MFPSSTTAPIRACGPCRARRVKCDRGSPTCARCDRAGRQCSGYGMKLSWPRPNDTKRNVIGPEPATSDESRSSTPNSWIHVSMEDLELHEYLLGVSSGFDRHSESGFLVDGALQQKYGFGVILDPRPFRMEADDGALLQYFERIASSTLSTFGQDQNRLKDALIRMSLSDRSPSAMGVLYSLLAFSSLHLHGHRPRTARHKLVALKALNSSVDDRAIGLPQAIQHAAAGMLLCSFEIERPSESYDDWFVYSRGAKGIMEAVKIPPGQIADQDTDVVLSWVQYYDMLSHFSAGHWQYYPPRDKAQPTLRRRETQQPMQNYLLCKKDSIEVSKRGLPTIPDIQGRSCGCHDILRLISFVCDAVRQDSTSRSKPKSVEDTLRELERRLTNIEVLRTSQNVQRNAEDAADLTVAIQLHRLAALVYLDRASESVQSNQSKVTRWIDQAFSLMANLEVCRWPYPLLILGVEARCDSRRALILDLISRSEAVRARKLDCLRSIIQGIWIQDDLANGEVSYVDKMSGVMSGSKHLPVLV